MGDPPRGGTATFDGATAATPAPDTLAPGDLVGGVYRVERLLGEGGGGAVFLVRHEGLGGARFALKVLHTAPDRSVEALTREGRLAAQVRSAHVVKVTALGRLPRGAPYLVMEHVEGPTLEQLIAERTLTVAEAIDCGRQLCLALEAAHGEGLMHGDVSLRNVFATPQPDGRLHLQLGDFGLVRRVRHAPGTTVSVELDTTRGTPRFMAPEVIAGDQVDERADLFAVGVVLYRLVAAAFPFDGATSREIFTATLRGRPEPLARRADVGALAPVVMRCLELDPALRFTGARELREALDAALLGSPTTGAGPAPAGAQVAVAAVTAAPSVSSVPSLPARRRRWRWAAAAGAVTAAAAAVVVLTERGDGRRSIVAAAPTIDPAPGAATAPPAPTRQRVVRLAVGGDTCLTVTASGAEVGVAACDRVDDPVEQHWTLEDVSDLPGDDTIQVRGAGGRCLSWSQEASYADCDPAPGSTTRFFRRKRVQVGGNVWTFEPFGEPTRCLRAAGVDTIDWPGRTDCERWNERLIWRIEEVVPLELTTTITLDGKCLGVRGGHQYSADTAGAELRACDPAQRDQRWHIMPVHEDGAPTGFIQLRNAWKGLCLEVGNVDTHDVGSHVGVYMCDGGGLPNRDSHWRPVAVSASEHRLENRVSRLYATASSSTEGAGLTVAMFDGTSPLARFTAPASFWAAPPARPAP